MESNGTLICNFRQAFFWQSALLYAAAGLCCVSKPSFFNWRWHRRQTCTEWQLTPFSHGVVGLFSDGVVVLFSDGVVGLLSDGVVSQFSDGAVRLFSDVVLARLVTVWLACSVTTPQVLGGLVGESS